MTLHPVQFEQTDSDPAGHRFHGTTADLKPGDMIYPGKEIGRSNFDYTDETGLRKRGDPNEYVHAGDELTAWEYAGYGGRRTVYELDPSDEGERDPNINTASRWRHAVPIKNRIDIMHPGVFSKNLLHVQGTLPPVDWNQFKTSKGSDVNQKAVYEDTPQRPLTTLEHVKNKRQQMEANLERLRAHRQIPGQGKFF